MSDSKTARLAAACFLVMCATPAAAFAAPCAGSEVLTCADGTACADASTCPGNVDCVSDCAPGGTQPTADCYLSLKGIRLNHPPDTGPAQPKAKKELRCTDGDPRCDRDGAVDNVCTFALAACFNDDSAALPRCDAALGVRTFTVKNKTGAKRDVELANLQTRGSVLLPTTVNVCATPTTITVALKDSRQCTTFKKAKKTVSARVESLPTLDGKVFKDSDKLTLVCMPAAVPAACGRLRGFVTDVAGRPLADVTAVAGTHEATSDAGGSFLLDVARVGTVPIQLSKPGFLATVVAAPIEAAREVTFTATLVARSARDDGRRPGRRCRRSRG